MLIHANKDKNPPVDKFTYNFQYADYKSDQVDEKGEVDYQKILNEFTSFPWEEQLAKATVIRKTSPTIGIKDWLTHTDLGISVVNYANEPVFYVFYITAKGDKVAEDVSVAQVKHLIALFFQRDQTSLKNYFK